MLPAVLHSPPASPEAANPVPPPTPRRQRRPVRLGLGFDPLVGMRGRSSRFSIGAAAEPAGLAGRVSNRPSKKRGRNGGAAALEPRKRERIEPQPVGDISVLGLPDLVRIILKQLHGPDHWAASSACQLWRGVSRDAVVAKIRLLDLVRELLPGHLSCHPLLFQVRLPRLPADLPGMRYSREGLLQVHAALKENPGLKAAVMVALEAKLPTPESGALFSVPDYVKSYLYLLLLDGQSEEAIKIMGSLRFPTEIQKASARADFWLHCAFAVLDSASVETLDSARGAALAFLSAEYIPSSTARAEVLLRLLEDGRMGSCLAGQPMVWARPREQLTFLQLLIDNGLHARAKVLLDAILANQEAFARHDRTKLVLLYAQIADLESAKALLAGISNDYIRLHAAVECARRHPEVDWLQGYAREAVTSIEFYSAHPAYRSREPGSPQLVMTLAISYLNYLFEQERFGDVEVLIQTFDHPEVDGINVSIHETLLAVHAQLLVKAERFMLAAEKANKIGQQPTKKFEVFLAMLASPQLSDEDAQAILNDGKSAEGAKLRLLRSIHEARSLYQRGTSLDERFATLFARFGEFSRAFAILRARNQDPLRFGVQSPAHIEACEEVIALFASGALGIECK